MGKTTTEVVSIHPSFEVNTHTHSTLCLELILNPPDGFTAGPVSEDNFFEWEAEIS
jgi:hypothetical protein